ncbi:MAG: hypothetical protein NTX64_14920 [Elusimicrobia bacterium]|nr:hypothetical protein [Elusimicrobiota bacterium]
MVSAIGLLTLLLGSPLWCGALDAQGGPAYRQLQGAAAAGGGQTPAAAATSAGRTFDEPVDHSLFAAPAAPAAPVPTLRPSGDFVVGGPQRLSEPNNPLPKRSDGRTGDGGGSMGWGMRALGVLLGGLLCGGLGFLLGGPLGAAIGFAGGAIGGWFATGS